MSPERRRFSDSEVEEIFSRAARRQEIAERNAPVPGGGFSLDELRAIGAEAGIDPDAVAAAALEVVGRSVGAAEREGEAVHHGRLVPAELSDRAWEAVVAELRRTYGRNGTISHFGPALEWHSGDDAERHPVTLRLTPVEAGVRVDLRRDVAALRREPVVLGGTFGAVTALISGLYLLGDFEPHIRILIAVLAVFTVVTGAGGWAWVRWWERREEERFQRLGDRIELLLRERAPPEG